MHRIGAWSLGWTMVTSPSTGAERTKPREALPSAVRVYLAFLVLYAVFFWLKPFDFPDANAGVPPESQGLGFWFKVMCFQPLLEVAWVVFLLGVARWFAAGRLAFRLIVGVFWTAVPFIWLVVYHQSRAMPYAVFALGAALWLASYALVIKRADLEPLRELLAFMLALNAVGIALLVPMTLFTAMRSKELFMLTQGLGGFWLLGAGALGLRKLTGLRMSRAFLAMLLSMFMQIAFSFTLHMLGIVPKEILKALLYA